MAQEALLYYRISLDPTGNRLGVDRQEPDTLAMLDRLGLVPGEVYVDNDLSATTGVRRPDFERLLADLTVNPRPVAVWHIDRLLRLNSDLERVIKTGVNVHAAHSGHIDLSTPAGRAVARTITAWSQYEGEQKAIRQKAAAKQRAQMGKAWWSKRPFGFNMDGTHHETEAPALAHAYERIIAGVPLATVASDLNDQGLPTHHGNRWTGMTLRPVLLSARNAGLRTYLGEEVGKGDWRPIVEEGVYRAVTYILGAEERKSGGGGARTGLLTGVASCGVCGSPVRIAWRGGRKVDPGSYPVYACRAGSHVSMRVEWVDTFVETMVLDLLRSPTGAALWSEDAEDAEGRQTEIVALRARLDMLADMLADGELTREQYQRGSEKVKERLRELEGTGRRVDTLQGLHGPLSAAEVAEEWSSLEAGKRRTFIEALTHSITINRRPRGSRTLSEGDIAIEWSGSPER